MPRQSNNNKKTSLNAVEQYELNQWLEQNHVNSTNLRRSFTDVLPLARLMSRYYPELIDLNYYPPRNSVQNKVCNWESFNKRVLTRLGVHLTREQMVRVARSVPGSVDLLLHNIMRVQLAAERKAREAKGSTDDDDDDDIDVNDVVVSNDSTGHGHEASSTAAATAAGGGGGAGMGSAATAEKKKMISHLDDDDDDGDMMLPPKPNMPKTLKLAQAVLKRSERSHMMSSTRGGIGGMTNNPTGILQRARGTTSHRRLTAAGTTPTDVNRDRIGGGGGCSGGGGFGVGGGVNAGVGLGVASVASPSAVRGEQQEKKQQQRMVLYSHYQQAVKQLQQKNDKIARFDQLSAHLENMLQLKCERIDELQQQVTNAVNLLKPMHATSTAKTTAAGTTTGTTGTTNNTTHKRMRLKRRIRYTTNNSIEHKMGTIAIPGIGIAGAPFPVKLSPIQ